MLLFLATSALAAFGFERAAVHRPHVGGAASPAVLNKLRTPIPMRAGARLARGPLSLCVLLANGCI